MTMNNLISVKTLSNVKKIKSNRHRIDLHTNQVIKRNQVKAESDNNLPTLQKSGYSKSHSYLQHELPYVWTVACIF